MGAHNGWKGGRAAGILDAIGNDGCGGGSRKCAADSQKASIPLEPMLLKAKQFLFSRDLEESNMMGENGMLSRDGMSAIYLSITTCREESGVPCVRNFGLKAEIHFDMSGSLIFPQIVASTFVE